MICKLKDLLEANKISQLGLAQQTGLSPGTVGKLARGEFTRIDENTVITLCRFFNLRTLTDLIDIQLEDGDQVL
ncbi:helix-turn-helix domain-containing protein [Cuspidothrix issatschenkoi]|uniref:helix-turn-helix domain-containing protein n=1 Tax=Cuspidothrix issatschenkoi TaxID=230752 RepID=UPI001D144181|nr:helix-turn-helix transcriptional regulator [Cuspidothrix issatschenkoi]